MNLGNRADLFKRYFSLLFFLTIDKYLNQCFVSEILLNTLGAKAFYSVLPPKGLDIFVIGSYGSNFSIDNKKVKMKDCLGYRLHRIFFPLLISCS